MSDKEILLKILETTKSWENLKQEIIKYSKIIEKKSGKGAFAGRIFELFTKYYFLVEPTVRDDYKNVWLYREIPLKTRKKLNIGYVEYGIDLILEDIEGQLTAVQCKFKYDESTKLYWSKDKISNLFGFVPNADRFIVFTNAADLDEVSKTRVKYFSFYNINNLLEIKRETFKAIYETIAGYILPKIKKYTPQEHQEKAIQEGVEYLKYNNRGQLLLPCGAGKTFTALWIKESLRAENTLVLVPSLALLRQIKNQWAEHKNSFYKYLCVCSEKDIDSIEKDSFVTQTYEIGSRVTTIPEVIREFISKDDIKVIFSTYQSLDSVKEAIRGTDFYFDLVVCDEAHRTAGIKPGFFGLIHKNKNIPADKRIYMTATPRVLSTTIKRKYGDEIDYLYDMSNPDTFGDEFYRMSFKEAIDSGILVDYKIIAIGVKEKEIKKNIERRRLVSYKDSLDEIANNYALEMIMNKYKAFHAITFHSRVKYAQEFSNRHRVLFGNNILSDYVSGKQTTSIRSLKLNAFKKAKKAVISNARCLTEGVDVPAIDVVYFCDPKNSKIDIVQAAGRALRKDHVRNKTMGYVVVPVYHKEKKDLEEAIEQGIFKNLIQVIRSLADQDERLQDEINQIAFEKGKYSPTSKRIEVIYGAGNQNVIILTNFEKKLRKALFDQIVEKASVSWDLIFLKLKEWLKVNGEYPSSEENEALYNWISQQRIAINNKKLSLDRIEKLNSINFAWDAVKYKWNKYYNLLKDFRKKYPERWPSQRSKETMEHILAVWFLQLRRDYRNDKLPTEVTQKLKDIDFPFEPKDYHWLNGYHKLKKWLIEYGEYPTQKYNRYLYQWCKRNKEYYTNYKLNKQKKKLLNEIDFKKFMEYNPKDEKWNENFEELRIYLEKNPGKKVPQQINGKRNTLARWIDDQKKLLKQKRLSKNKIKKLKSLRIDLEIRKKRKTWDECIEELGIYLENNPGKSIPPKINGKSNRLYNWLGSLKQQYKKKTLSQEKIEKLESLGIDLKVAKRLFKSWNERFEELRTYIENNPGRWGPSVYINGKLNPLYKWLRYQRQNYREQKLPKEKVEKLESLNVKLDKVK